MSNLVLPGEDHFVFPPSDEVTQAELDAHVAAADPHTGYRLESADHSHQSTGLQGGQLDHGLSLVGLADDDHTQYMNSARLTQFHSFLRAERITSAQSIADNTMTTVVWNSIAVEDDTADVIDVNTGTGVFTVNATGIYLVTAWASFDNTAAAYLRQLLRLFLNGTTQIQASDWWARNTLGASNMILSCVWKFTATDTFTIDALQDNTSATAQNLQIGAQATVTRLA